MFIFIYSAFFGLDNKESDVVYEFIFTRISLLSMKGLELQEVRLVSVELRSCRFSVLSLQCRLIRLFVWGFK